MEDSLILWLNKVSESVCRINKEEVTALLLDPDPLQRRRNKVKLMNSPEIYIPPIDQLGAGITDGQCLAALLIHYTQDSAKCAGMNSIHTFCTESYTSGKLLNLVFIWLEKEW